jgi:putative CocE/NonD family hydrolase
MVTRDGIRLDADVYRPELEGEFPVLLMRQPYGRAIASTVVYAHPAWYAAQGYIVVVQDVRGRGSSEGEFDLFAHEINDGYDAVTWAAALPGSTGQVGMYGFSYQGMTQLYAAIAHPPALKTICPSMIAYNLYADWAYEGGAFCYQLNLGWAIQLATETARRQNNAEAYQALYAASRQLPIHDPVNAVSELLNQLAPDSFYHTWLKHSQPDDYWETLSPHRYLHDVDLPMLHIGGWFDPYLRGTLRLYREMSSRSQFPQQLWVGPWAHLPWGRKAGIMDYGPDAASPIDRLQIQWFDQFLKNFDTGILQSPPIHWFEMGSNQWCTFDTYPADSPTAYTLQTTGLASMGDREGTLILSSELSPLHDKASPSPTPFTDPFTDIVVHDPWRPVPALGGHATLPAGVFDRSAIDARTDVLTYTSAVISDDLHLAGDLIVELECGADAPSFDLCAVLSEVKPGGVYPISQGYLRVNAPVTAETTVAIQTDKPQQRFAPLNQSRRVQIRLQPTCIQIAKGHALRLSVSAACFPAFAVNGGDRSPSGQGHLLTAKVISIAIHCGGDRPSQLLLPTISLY